MRGADVHRDAAEFGKKKLHESAEELQVRNIVLCAVAALTLLGSAKAAEKDKFYLKDGDRVVFYGDSITEQRNYTIIVETYIATRYPNLNVTFVNSGWGGDTVNGGGGGPIDTRLNRDVLPYKPTVMTIMLGMNDGGYKAETQNNDEKYFSGYRHIVETLQAAFPGVRITAIEPSPYDDVAHTPAFPVSGDIRYNEVMRSFGKWIVNYADEKHIDVADLNTGMVNMVTQANKLDPGTAKDIIPDRVHPSFAGHLIMAEQLLKSWGARPMVSSVTFNATAKGWKLESAEFAKVTEIAPNGALAWTEADESLPLPFKQWQEMWGGGATVGLAIRSSDVTEALNTQLLKVKGLRSGTYSLKIDGESVGAFNNDQLAEGINLALLKTPATEQAMKVYQLASLREEIHFDAWRNVQVPLDSYALAQSKPAIDAMEQLNAAVAQKMRELGHPATHKFELVAIQ